jgi:cytidyltransferase-like protein
MGLLTLNNIYKEKGKEFIDSLFNSYVIVSEQIDGSRFLFQRQFNDELIYYKGVGSPISFVDRALMKFYEKAINHIENLHPEVLDMIPDNWTFGFQYFPSLSPIKIVYERLPKNNLILTDISIRNDAGRVIKVINDPKILTKWSEILNVERPPIIFSGHLTTEQKDKIRDFLDTNETDLISLFKSNSFTRYIITILNPSLTKTALSNSLDKDIEGIIFKFIKDGQSEIFSAKVIDPVFQYTTRELNSKPPRKSNDMYQIAMLDIVEFMEEYDLSKLHITEEDQEARYVELISSVFNDYVERNGHKYIGVNFDTPEFAKKPEFEVNTKFIRNARTKDIIKNEYMSNLFKIILSSFRKYRKSSTDILTDVIINSINDIVDRIEKRIREEVITDVALDFETFLKSNVYKGEKSMFEQEIFSGLNLDTREQGLKKVNIIVGRFQPFTLGHMKVLEQIHKQNGHPIVIFIVRGVKSNFAKNPIDADTQIRMFGELKKEYRFLEAMRIIPTAAIDTIFNSLRPAYEPVLWGSGTDRLKSYRYQVDKYGEDLNALSEFDIYEIKRDDEDISATKVRDALTIEDYDTYKKMTPKSIHSFFDELKAIINPIDEEVTIKLSERTVEAKTITLISESSEENNEVDGDVVNEETPSQDTENQ